MAKIIGLYLLSFVLELFRKQSHAWTLWIGISCSARTMGLLSTLDLEVLDRKVALYPGAARRGINRKEVLCKSFEKLESFLQFFKTLGVGEGRRGAAILNSSVTLTPS
jgi:hypothetical protein